MNCNSDKYRFLIENLPDAFAYHQVVKDNNGKPVDYIFLEVNAAFEEMTGLKREEIISNKVTEVLPGIEKSEFDWISTYGQVALSGEPIRFENFSEPLGRWYDISAYSDAPGCFGVLFHDITERKQTENQLTEFKAAVEQSIDGIALSDMAGYISFVNESWAAAHGYTTKELIGKHLSFFHTSGQLPEVNSFIEKLKSSRSYQGEIRHVCKNGKTFDTWMSATVILDSDNKPFVLLAVMRDITENKRKEEALLESEENYRRLFETMAQGVIYQDKEGRIVSANPAAEDILGLSLKEMQGKTSKDPHWQMVKEDGTPVSGEDHPAMIALRTGQKISPVTMGVFHAEKNYHIWLSITAIPLFQPGEEKPFQAYATFTDITERNTTEKRLKEEFNLRNALLDNIPNCIALILKKDTREIVASNKAGQEIGAVPGKTCFQTSALREDPCPFCLASEMWSSGQLQQVEVEYRGTWYEGIWAPLSNDLYVHYIFDITGRKKTEEALQESETRFQRMLKVIPDMVSVHDSDMNIVYSNWKGFAAVPPEKQVLNTKCYKTYRDYDQICPDCRAIKVIDSKEFFQEEVELSEDYWINLRVIPIFDRKGELEYFIEWVRDISDLKAIEEELKELNVNLERKVEERTAQLEAANRELDAFTHSASHDLRGPLNRISGFSNALLEDCSDQLNPQSRHYLMKINTSCEHMKHLIDDLLKLSRVSQVQISREPVELSALANVCLKELKARVPDRPVETFIASDLVVEGDTALLRIALENLLGNAWKFSAGEVPSHIEFGSTFQEGKEVYYIRDNGTGFDMQHAKKLFTAFQRLHDAKKYPGTGIGLSIVSRIIHRHGGEIWAEGEPGNGACFYFTLPKIN